MNDKTYKGWGTCLDCGYEGMLEYRPVAGESYTDPEALGVVMALRCPACESQDQTLLAMDYYHELLTGE